jgi:hypothetical protein
VKQPHCHQRHERALRRAAQIATSTSEPFHHPAAWRLLAAYMRLSVMAADLDVQ